MLGYRHPSAPTAKTHSLALELLNLNSLLVTQQQTETLDQHSPG